MSAVPTSLPSVAATPVVPEVTTQPVTAVPAAVPITPESAPVAGAGAAVATAIAVPEPNGKPAAAAPSPSTIIRESKETIQADGVYTVPLSMLDNERYPNARNAAEMEDAYENFIPDLAASIGVSKMTVAISGAWEPDGSRIDIIDGHCRYNALCVLALDKLVREFNRTNGYSPSDDGFVNIFHPAATYTRLKDGVPMQRHGRDWVRQAGGEWAAKYDAALAATMVNVTTQRVADDLEASVRCLGAFTRKELSVASKVAEIVRVLGLGYKANKLAKAISASEPAISHAKNVYGIPEMLRGIAADADKYGVTNNLTPETVAGIKAAFATAIDEYERRTSLRENEPTAIKFSLCRDLYSALNGMPNKDIPPLPFMSVLKVLSSLVGLSQTGKPQPKAEVMNYGDFKAMIDDERKALSATVVEVTAGAVTGGGTPTSTTAPGTAPVSTGNSPVVAPVNPGVPGGIISGGATVAGVATPGTPVTGVTPGVSTADLGATQTAGKDAATEASIKAANLASGTPAASPTVPADDIIAGDEVESMDALLASSANDPAAQAAEQARQQAAEAAKASGQLQTKTREAELQRYRPLPGDTVEKLANTMLVDCEAATATMLDIPAYLLAAKELFNTLGMAVEADAINQVYAEYLALGDEYLGALQAFLAAKGTDEEKARIEAMRPVYSGVKLSA